MKDLIAIMDPKYIEVCGLFTPRGGISIFPFVNYAKVGEGYSDFAKDRQKEQAAASINWRLK